jgi:hypothetical protein
LIFLAKFTTCHKEAIMDELKGLTIEQAVEKGVLIPIDTEKPDWVEKLMELMRKPKKTK